MRFIVDISIKELSPVDKGIIICYNGIEQKMKKITQAQKTILYDLEALKDCFITKNKKDFDYHFDLLKSNLQDYFKK